MIGTKIKEIAKSKGYSISSLAEKMGIKQESLSRSINGNPTLDSLQKIADSLGVPITDLFEQPAKDVINCPYCGNKIKIVKD